MVSIQSSKGAGMAPGPRYCMQSYCYFHSSYFLYCSVFTVDTSPIATFTSSAPPLYLLLVDGAATFPRQHVRLSVIPRLARPERVMETRRQKTDAKI